MKHRLATAFNVGVIIAIFVILLRQPDGGYMAAVFAAVLAVCLAAWWVISRRKDGRGREGRRHGRPGESNGSGQGG